MGDLTLLTVQSSPRWSLGELALVALVVYALLAITRHLRHPDKRIPLALGLVAFAWYFWPDQIVSEILGIVLFGLLLFSRRRTVAGDENRTTGDEH